MICITPGLGDGDRDSVSIIIFENMLRVVESLVGDSLPTQTSGVAEVFFSEVVV